MSASPLELPIEPVPRTIVLREPPPEPPAPFDPTPASTDFVPVAVDDPAREPELEPRLEPRLEPELEPQLEPELERDEAGPDTLRPEEPEPTSPVTQIVATPRRKPAKQRRTRTRTTRPLPPPRFEDRRHPVRAAFGLVALVAFSGLAFAAAVAVAIGAVALALRDAAAG